MGEFADYAVQEMEEAETDRWLFRMGDLTYAEAYERGIIDEMGYEASAGRAGAVVCRHCGKRCRWLRTNAGWRTGEADGGIHHCPRFQK